ncbi:NUT family member 2G-like [Erethizon dorsatum]
MRSPGPEVPGSALRESEEMAWARRPSSGTSPGLDLREPLGTRSFLGPALHFGGSCQRAVVSIKTVGMALEGASPVFQPDVTLNHGVILSPSWVLPPLQPAAVPLQQLHWKLLPPPFGIAPLPQPNSLVLSHFPRIPMVAGHGDYGLTGAGPFNISAQTGTAGRPAGSLLTQKVVLTQAPLIRGAPGVLNGGVQHPAPLLLRAPPMTTFMPAPTGVTIHADDRMWPQGLHPPAIPPVPPIMSGVNKVPPPHWDCGEGSLATSQASASPDHTCKSPSVYENFRHWQHFKTLLWTHLPHTPDVEAVSCFLVPMLRSLSQRHPTMSVEEGLQIGVREWDRTTNYERMTFYEVAEEFMEFEAAEEMEDPRLQLMGRLLDCPLPSPRRPDPPRSPDVQQPGGIPTQTGSKAQAACPPAPKWQQSQETKVPDNVPPEAVREYIDTMDWLEERHLLTIGEHDENQEEEQQPEEDEIFRDPELLSYCDELCSQEDFVTKVEAVINPQFLVEVESTDLERDIILAVRQVLEEEHALTPEQLVEKRLLGSKEKGGVCRPRSEGAPQSAACQDAERDDCNPKQRVNKETCPAPKASEVLKRRWVSDEELLEPEVPAVLHRRHGSAPLRDSGPSTFPQDLAPRYALSLRGASPAGGPWEPPSGLGEDEGDFSSLSFLLASPRQLLPWEWPQTPGPDVGLLCPEGPAPQASPPQGGGLSPDLPPSARSKKRVLTGGSAPMGKMSRPGPSSEVSTHWAMNQYQLWPVGNKAAQHEWPYAWLMGAADLADIHMVLILQAGMWKRELEVIVVSTISKGDLGSQTVARHGMEP